MGMLCSLIANINRDPKKTKPYSALDFMPWVPEEHRKAEKNRKLVAQIFSALKPVKKVKKR